MGTETGDGWSSIYAKNMSKKYADNLELLEGAMKDELYGALVKQLKKDFELANVPMEIPVEIKANDLIAALREKIYRLLLERFTDYLNLLYVVDVPEKAFKELEVSDVVEVADEVTFLILKRERQKVWLKNRYSG
ncbi:MAG TPA: hypothetical protein VKN36_14035 [Eudoraea sp.]|nr:hypothetical protein [Eudoraea sp.]